MRAGRNGTGETFDHKSGFERLLAEVKLKAKALLRADRLTTSRITKWKRRASWVERAMVPSGDYCTKGKATTFHRYKTPDDAVSVTVTARS